MADIRFDNVSFSYERHLVLESINLRLTTGKFYGIVGPNGAGKSTLLKLMDRILIPTSGAVYLSGRPLAEYTLKELARHIALIPQEPEYHPFKVREIVALGRYPYERFSNASYIEDDIVEEAMHETGITNLAERRVDRLSGGERQRVTVARALAQQSEILLLDEPTNHLDIEHQLHICRLLHKKARAGAGCVAVLHDLNLVSAYCDEVLVLNQRQLVEFGPPDEVLTPSLIKSVYGVEVPEMYHPETGRPIIVPFTGYTRDTLR